MQKQNESMNAHTEERNAEFMQKTSEDIVKLKEHLNKIRELKNAVKKIVEKVQARRATAQQDADADADFSALEKHNVVPDSALACFRGVDFGAPKSEDYDAVFTIYDILKKEKEEYKKQRDPELVQAPSYHWFAVCQIPAERKEDYGALFYVFEQSVQSKTEVWRAAVYA